MKVILTESQIKRVLEQKNDIITSLKEIGFVPSGNGVFKHSQKPELTVTLAGEIVVVKNNGVKIAEIKTNDIKDLEGTIKSTSLKEQVVQGAKNDPYEYKKEGDTYYAKKKGSTKWIKTSGKVSDAIKTKIFNSIKPNEFSSIKPKEQVVQGDKNDPYEYKKEGDTYYVKKKRSTKWIKTSGKVSDAIKTKIFNSIKPNEFSSIKPKEFTPYKLSQNTFDSGKYQRDTFEPYAQQNIKQKRTGEIKAQQFAKGIVPVKKSSGIKPHFRLFSDFLTLRKSPVTTSDFTPEELKTILSIIKTSKVGKESKNVNFSSDINFSKVKSGDESQLNPDMKKSIGYTLGNAQVQDMGGYYRITDIYDFNNYHKNPKNYSLNNLPSTVSTAFKKLFSGNMVQGVEELASYYQKLGYNGIPVKIDIPKNLV